MKKILICFLMTILCMALPLTSVNALNNRVDINDGGGGTTETTPTPDEGVPEDFEHNCADFAGAIRIGGVLIFLVKIFLPLIIIAKSSIDIGKVVMSGNSGDFPKQAKKMGISIVSAIIIFFLPTLINTVFSFINGFEDNRSSDAEVCAACLFDPYSSTCESHIKK